MQLTSELIRKKTQLAVPVSLNRLKAYLINLFYKALETQEVSYTQERLKFRCKVSNNVYCNERKVLCSGNIFLAYWYRCTCCLPFVF